ncbi:MAG: hypothetical protein MUF64_15600 [Polyangiaceae bacterium]|jgi:hypothetical protein|nr:hypothetical protein [Polyangiaceae bacterium]
MFAPRTTLLLLSLSALLSSGCATIFNGTSTEVSIASEPTNAKFRVVSTGGGITSTKGVEYASGATPARITLSNKSEYVVYVKADGYEEAKVPVQQTLNGWLICSGLCGLVPAGIDVLTGGMWDLAPEQLSITLVPLRGAAPPAAPAPVAPASPDPAAGASLDGPGSSLYVILRARGEDGQLRYTAIPLVPEIS